MLTQNSKSIIQNCRLNHPAVSRNPSSDSSNIFFTRHTPPPFSPNSTSNMFYQNRFAFTSTRLSSSNVWDDWYETNRRNTKLCIFQADNVNNSTIGNIQYTNAICSLSLEKVTQVSNYKNTTGTYKTREPDWGPYYTYSFDPNVNTVWNLSTSWFSTTTFADFAPNISIGYSNYSNVFLTPPLENYTNIPRSFGVATSINYPVADLTNDIKHGFVAIPFYKDPQDNVWKVGSFKGLTYTKVPCLPSATLLGDSPYYGPVGGFGWSNVGNNLLPNDFCFWNSKISFHNLELVYDPATDLKLFGGS